MYNIKSEPLKISSESKRITIYHSNDIHSNYDVLKRIHSYIKKNKTENDLFLDSGDYCDLKSPIVQADKGISGMELFMSCELDGITIGNNEGDLTYEPLCELSKAGFPFIVTNVTDNDDRPIPGIPGSKIYNKAGKRILVVGTAPYYNKGMVPNGYNVFLMMGNVKIHEPVKAIKDEIAKNKGKFDYCILLAHGGYDAEEEYMKICPEIDLCLGGHSHEVINHKGYSQSSTGLENLLGKITLEVDGDRISIIENVQIELEETEDEEFDALFAEKENRADAVLAKELDIVEELDFDPFSENSLINFICDCLMKKFPSDFAIMHNGIAESPILRPVSRKSLIEILPSKLNPTMMPVKGADIIEAVKLSFDEEHIRGEGRGPGFRGHVLGTLGFSANVQIAGEPFSMRISGEDIDPEKIYKVVTDDYLQRGTGYPSLATSDDKAEYHIWFIRDLVENFLTDKAVFDSAKIPRRIIKQT